MFVHGGGAHAHWWTHVAAAFAGEFRVVAIDLSGHGDSDHRAAYDGQTWAAELLAVLDAARCHRPVVAAHSLGGRVALFAATAQPDLPAKPSPRRSPRSWPADRNGSGAPP